jgi:hypothetical protein
MRRHAVCCLSRLRRGAERATLRGAPFATARCRRWRRPTLLCRRLRRCFHDFSPPPIFAAAALVFADAAAAPILRHHAADVFASLSPMLIRFRCRLC